MDNERMDTLNQQSHHDIQDLIKSSRDKINISLDQSLVDLDSKFSFVNTTTNSFYEKDKKNRINFINS